MPVSTPLRGEIWTVDLNPTRGREQAGTRLALVVSESTFNRGPADLVIGGTITSKAKGIPLHVRIVPPEGGVRTVSYIKPEDVRSISQGRLGKRWGSVLQPTMDEVDDRLRIVLNL